MFNGKMKAITFSYDDCTLQDIRLTELFNKYGIKATFNVNSELLGTKNELIREGVLVNHDKIEAKDVKRIFKGHEIAVHTLTHPRLQEIEDDNEVIRQVEQDRIALSKLVDYEVVGMAYPCNGNDADRVADIIRRHTGVKYARTTISTMNFEPQTNLLQFNPTIHRVVFDDMFRLGEEFLALKPDTPKIYYIWGHSFEFDIFDTWDKMEEFLKMMSGMDDIFYGTNREVLIH